MTPQAPGSTASRNFIKATPRNCVCEPQPSSHGNWENAADVSASYDFSIKWLTPFYPANPSQAAGGGEKCMDLRFLRLRRWLLKQQPNKTVFNRFIENWYQIWFNLYDPATEDAIYDSYAISSISLLSAKALFCPRHSRGFPLVQPTEKPGTMDCSSQVFCIGRIKSPGGRLLSPLDSVRMALFSGGNLHFLSDTVPSACPRPSRGARSRGVRREG